MKGYIALLATALTFGLFGVLINYSGEMFGDYFQLLLRNAIAMTLIVSIFIFLKKSFKIPKPELKILLINSCFAIFAFSAVTLAYLYTDIKSALAFRHFTLVVISVPITLFVFSETIRRINYVSLGLVFAGLFTFIYASGDVWQVGNLYAIIASLMFAVTNIIIKKYPISPERIMLVEFPFMTFALLAYILLTSQPLVTGFSWVAIISTFVFGVMLVAVTYMIVYGFRNTNFNLANIILTSEIFFGILLGWLFLGQTINSLEFVGITIIFIAAVLPNVWAYWQQRKNIAEV